MISILLIGVSLSLDAFAVSVSSGISDRGINVFHMLRASFFFGAFQFVMPVIGWRLGNAFVSSITAFDHWIACALLAFIGGKMLVSALPRKNRERAVKNGVDIQSLGNLFVLAVATSIDALAVGLTFSMVNRGIYLPALIIGCVTFGVCFLGFQCGKKIGRVFETGSQLAGGIILIGIGVKILLEHTL
jgi:putative Mn2+ efflux pump MntP